jgi:hypothetical protein
LFLAVEIAAFAAVASLVTVAAEALDARASSISLLDGLTMSAVPASALACAIRVLAAVGALAAVKAEWWGVAAEAAVAARAPPVTVATSAEATTTPVIRG